MKDPTTTPEALARAAIQARLNGTHAGNGADTGQFGPWAGSVQAIGDAYAMGKAPAAKAEFARLASNDKALAALIAGGNAPTNEPGHWQICTLADAYKPRPPRQYVIDGLLKVPSLNIVYGAPGCLKTMLLIDAGLDVASGRPWLAPLPDKPGTARGTLLAPVLWIDMDNGADEMAERIEALARARDLPEDTPFYYVSMPTPWLDASQEDTDSFLELRAQALETGAKLIIIDNLGVAAGSIEENSAGMAKVLSAFRRLAEDSDAAVVLIHHQRKQSGVKARAGDTLRGHSSIEASLNLALLVEREEHANSITVKATKTRGADVWPFGAIFTFEHKGDTDEMARARFYGVEIEDNSSDRALVRVLLETVKELQPVNKTKLVATAKKTLPDVGVNRLQAMVDWLASDGKLAVHPGKRTEKLYTLPDQAVVSTDSLLWDQLLDAQKDL